MEITSDQLKVNSAFYRAIAVPAVPPVFFLISKPQTRLCQLTCDVTAHLLSYDNRSDCSLKSVIRAGPSCGFHHPALAGGGSSALLLFSQTLLIYSVFHLFYNAAGRRSRLLSAAILPCETASIQHPEGPRSLPRQYGPSPHFQHRKQKSCRRRYGRCKGLSSPFQSQCAQAPG